MKNIKLYDFLITQRNDLIRKKLLPKHTLGFFTEKNVRGAMMEYQKEVFKERTCPICAISIKAPGMWMQQHMKIHAIKARDSDKIKDDSPIKTEGKVYF